MRGVMPSHECLDADALATAKINLRLIERVDVAAVDCRRGVRQELQLHS